MHVAAGLLTVVIVQHRPVRWIGKYALASWPIYIVVARQDEGAAAVRAAGSVRVDKRSGHAGASADHDFVLGAGRRLVYIVVTADTLAPKEIIIPAAVPHERAFAGMVAAGLVCGVKRI